MVACICCGRGQRLSRMVAGLVNYFIERVESDVFWRSPECYRGKQTWAGLHDMGCLPIAKGLLGIGREVW